VITHVEAHYADRTDSELLGAVLKNTVAVVQQQHLRVQQIAGDSGYCWGKALQACIDHRVLLPLLPTLAPTSLIGQALFIMQQTILTPVKQKACTYLTRKPVTIRKAMIKSSTAARQGTVPPVHGGPPLYWWKSRV
jgi:hypothetical protein